MRAVFLEVPRHILIERQKAGLDRFDEMWDGELHMVPMPAWEHGRLLARLVTFFETHWAQLGEGVFAPTAGVRPKNVRWVKVAAKRLPQNYRGPDLVFLRAGHEDRIKDGWVAGAPDAVLEIRSPRDETYEKFPFFFALGIPEVIVVHRDTKSPEVYRRGPSEYDRVAPDPEGWVRSEVLDTLLRAARAPSGEIVLHLRRGRHPERAATA